MSLTLLAAQIGQRRHRFVLGAVGCSIEPDEASLAELLGPWHEMRMWGRSRDRTFALSMSSSVITS